MKTDTITTGNAFSFKRFANYLLLYASVNKRKLILAALQITIFTFLLTLLAIYNSNTYEYELNVPLDSYAGEESVVFTDYKYDPMWSNQVRIMIVLAFLFMAFAGSWTYNAMNDKKNRLNTIEIPAKQCEKFLAWWIIYVPVALILVFVSFWLADMFRVIWVKLFTDYGYFAHPLPLKSLLTFTDYPDYYEGIEGPETLLMYGMLLACNALFAVGSILFHRHSFLKTVLWGFILGVVATLLYYIGDSIIFSNLLNNEIALRFDGESIGINYSLGIFVLFIGLCLYLFSYFRYREDEIISRW